MLLTSALIFAAASQLVAGHGAIVNAVGDQGGQGTALGIDAATPRDGSRRNPFQQDTTRFRGDAADACGETLAGGDNNPTTQVAQMVAAGGQLPQISAGGELMMTLHQVNGDGAGPYQCMIDSTGTGQQWTNMAVSANVPGIRSNSRARATDFPLTAEIPAGQTCTGTAGAETGICMVRCNNAARAGPFGGCVPVQMASAAGNDTAAAAAAAPAAAVVGAGTGAGNTGSPAAAAAARIRRAMLTPNDVQHDREVQDVEGGADDAAEDLDELDAEVYDDEE